MCCRRPQCGIISVEWLRERRNVGRQIAITPAMMNRSRFSPPKALSLPSHSENSGRSCFWAGEIAARTAFCGDLIPPICSAAKNRRLSLPSTG